MDHSLPYLRAVALLDGDVMPAQFQPERISNADVQGLLKKVTVRPNHEYTEEYPAKMPAKITVRLNDGQVIEHEVHYFPGLASNRFTWQDAVEKFDRLVVGRADQGVSQVHLIIGEPSTTCPYICIHTQIVSGFGSSAQPGVARVFSERHQQCGAPAGGR